MLCGCRRSRSALAHTRRTSSGGDGNGAGGMERALECCMSQQLRVYQLPSSRHLEVLLRRMATDQAPHGVSYRGGLRKQVHTTLPTSVRRQSAQRARTYKGTPFAHVSKLGRGRGGGSRGRGCRRGAAAADFKEVHKVGCRDNRNLVGTWRRVEPALAASVLERVRFALHFESLRSARAARAVDRDVRARLLEVVPRESTHEAADRERQHGDAPACRVAVEWPCVRRVSRVEWPPNLGSSRDGSRDVGSRDVGSRKTSAPRTRFFVRKGWAPRRAWPSSATPGARRPTRERPGPEETGAEGRAPGTRRRSRSPRLATRRRPTERS